MTICEPRDTPPRRCPRCIDISIYASRASATHTPSAAVRELLADERLPMRAFRAPHFSPFVAAGAQFPHARCISRDCLTRAYYAVRRAREKDDEMMLALSAAATSARFFTIKHVAGFMFGRGVRVLEYFIVDGPQGEFVCNARSRPTPITATGLSRWCAANRHLEKAIIYFLQCQDASIWRD